MRCREVDLHSSFGRDLDSGRLCVPATGHLYGFWATPLHHRTLPYLRLSAIALFPTPPIEASAVLASDTPPFASHPFAALPRVISHCPSLSLGSA